MEKGKISVVINTYNASKFLARVLDSVKDFDEIVICDMESTDNTLDKQLTVYICSNDPALDKSFYRDQLKGATIVFPQGGQEDDLCLLSECDYLIGAPSTFSLVAAMYHDLPLLWIENKEDKISFNSFDKFNQLFRNIR